MGVDWESFKDTYNTWNDTSFKTSFDFVKYLYEKHDKYVGPVARELGLGWGTVNKYLIQLGLLEKKSKGGHNYVDRPIGLKEELFLSIPAKTMSKLSSKQIMARCNVSKHYCSILLVRHSRDYIRWAR
jgi:hypothetical protein